MSSRSCQSGPTASASSSGGQPRSASLRSGLIQCGDAESPLWANGSRVGSSSTSPRPAVRESRGLTPGNPDERAPVFLGHRPGSFTQGEPEPIYLSAVTGLDHSRGVRVAFGLSLVIFTSASDLGFGWWLWSRAWPRRPASTSNDTRRVESNLVRPGASRRAPHSEPSAASDRRTRTSVFHRG